MSEKAAFGDGRIDHCRFRHGAEVDVLVFEAALGGDSGKTRAGLDAVGGGLGFRHVRKHDLLDVAALRRAQARAPLVIGFFDVVVGNCHPFRQFRRRHRHDVDPAVFRRPEQDLALLEIFAELFVGRLRNNAGLRRAERHVLDAALFVLELIDGVEPGLRRRDAAGYGVDELPAQQFLPLLGDETLLGIAHVAQHHCEPRAVELTVGVLQMRIGRDVLGDFGVGNAEPNLVGALIEPGLGDHFAEHLPVEAERARLLRRQRMTEVAADLLQALVVGLPELFDRDFRRADGRQSRAAEAAKNVVDAPDRETAGKHRHDHGHEDAAKPIFGSLADTP